MVTTQLEAARSTDLPPIDIVRLGDRTPEEWLDWCAGMHVLTLPHGLFPNLGMRFMRRWYRAHLASPHGVGLVAVADGMPVGFLLGATDRPANVAWLLTHRRRELAVAGAVALVRRPRVLVHFVATRARRYARRLLARPADVSGVEARTGVSVVEAVVVLPHARRRGTGSRLVDAFLGESRAAGAQRVELVTKAGSSGAGRFYERRGWRLVRTHVDRDGDDVLTYRTDLPAVSDQ